MRRCADRRARRPSARSSPPPSPRPRGSGRGSGQRCVLGDERHVREHRAAAGRPTEHAHAALAGRDQSGDEVRAESTCRPRSARPNRPLHVPESRGRGRAGPSACRIDGRRMRPRSRSCHDPVVERRLAGPIDDRAQQTDHRLGVEPSTGSTVDPARQVRAQLGLNLRRRRRQVRVTNVPTPGRPVHKPSCSSSRYALSTVLGLIANSATTSLTVGS